MSFKPPKIGKLSGAVMWLVLKAMLACVILLLAPLIMFLGYSYWYTCCYEPTEIDVRKAVRHVGYRPPEFAKTIYFANFWGVVPRKSAWLLSEESPRSMCLVLKYSANNISHLTENYFKREGFNKKICRGWSEKHGRPIPDGHGCYQFIYGKSDPNVVSLGLKLVKFNEHCSGNQGHQIFIDQNNGVAVFEWWFFSR